MDGWIKLYRSMTEWEWYKDTNTKVVFLHLLLIASHKDTKYRGEQLDKGTVFTSVSDLTEQLNLTPKQIRVALDHLKQTGEIEVKRASKGQFIKCCNYADYQQFQESKNNTEGNQRAIKGQSKGNHTIEQECKEYKECKEESGAHAPTHDDIKEYILKERLNVNPDRFFNYYSAIGWKVNGQPITDWKSKLRQWHSEEPDTSFNVLAFEQYANRELKYGAD